MPLAGEYSWKESASAVHVRVALKGCSAKQVDVYAADVYVKISYPPRLIELDLVREVDEDGCKAKIKDGTLTLTLPKKACETWGALVVDAKAADWTKPKIRARRAEATERRRAREAQLAEKAKDRKQEDERLALRTQMGLESEERDLIEDLKAKEKTEAEEQVYETFKQLKQAEAVQQGEKKREKKEVSFDVDDADLDADFAESAAAADVVEEATEDVRPAAPVVVPPPRQTKRNVVNVTHTPRVFPTPMRESKLVEEHQWIAKHRAHLHKNAMLFGRKVDSRGVEEADPSWLKARGDEFFAAADFASAIQAYDAALEVDEAWPQCLANKAACQLKLADFDGCKASCSKALRALGDDVRDDGRADSDSGKRRHALLFAKVLARRAAALVGSGDFEAAVEDFRAAAGTCPENAAELTVDANRAESLAIADARKRAGDAFLGAGQVDEALGAYTEALEREPAFVSALANRAAAALAAGDCDRAVEDCTAALAVFETDDEAAGPLPPHGSQKRRDWVLRTLARRGAAFAKQGKLAQAIADYEAANLVAPDDASLKADLDALKQQEKDEANGLD